MKIQRFEAPDMPAALREVHRALGPEAVILEARPLPRSGGRAGVVVTAALDRHAGAGTGRAEAAGAPWTGAQGHASATHLQALARAAGQGPADAPRRAAEPQAGPRSDAPSSPERLRLVETPRPSETPAAPPAPGRRRVASEDEAAAEQARLREQVRRLGGLVSSEHFSRLPQRSRELYADLVAAEVDSNLVFTILERLAESRRAAGPEEASGRAQAAESAAIDLASLRRLLLSLLPAAPPRAIERAGERILVAGPPGAGKTLVAAALAARALARGLRPGLLSIDTFRAGGPVGLEHYARALGIPCATAFDPADLDADFAAAFSDCDLLLIDTPALTRREAEPGDQIRRFQAALGPARTLLVLPATAKVRDLAGVLETAAPLAPEGLIFTRVDETATRGGLLSLAVKSRLPICGVTLGRDILSALREASGEEIVAWALGAAREVPRDGRTTDLGDAREEGSNAGGAQDRASSARASLDTAAQPRAPRAPRAWVAPVVSRGGATLGLAG